jgi:1-acyl-sn-glycerol-3-phosphate acyltransferase
MVDDLPLTRMERVALKLAELANDSPRGKWLQTQFLRSVSYTWVRAGMAHRVFTEGLDDLLSLRPQTGVMMVANHRSFFDQYAMMMSAWMALMPWAQHLYFPVRSNFFYDQPLGVVVNAAVAAGAMYPPIYRQASRRALNDSALDKMAAILSQPGNVLGMHPEGTRGKGPDPYTFLPAQPGVGKLALIAKPMVLPCFILGLGNRVFEDVKWRFSREARREHAVIMVYGAPLDYSDLLAQKPRPTLYKLCADRFMVEIKKLSEREKELRAQLLAGEISDDDPRWIANRPIGKLYARAGKPG